MLRFGIVTNIDESKACARVQFNDNDNMVSYWLSVLQANTYKDKFYMLPDIGEQVVCLMDQNIEEGVILGAIYSGLDEVPVISKDKIKIKLEDGAEFEYDKKEHVLNIKCESININALINHTGLFLNSAGVVSEGDITDHTGSMQEMRSIYNQHTHNETDSVTQVPNQQQ